MSEHSLLPEEFHGLTYLVAEANPALQRLMTQSLAQAGVTRVVTAEDGNEAWQKFRAEKPIHMIIAGVGLPHMPGLDFLARARADAAFSGAFLLVGVGVGSPEANQALDKGADGVLPKPFSTELFLKTVAEGLETRKQVGGRDVFTRPMTPPEDTPAPGPLETSMKVLLNLELTQMAGVCEELANKRCVIRTEYNPGLGTNLGVQFYREGKPTPSIKGVVVKTERVPKELGVYRIHLQF